MKSLLLSSAMLGPILALTLAGCVSGHPSTDKHQSHVDTSATRYDKYDPDYDYKDKTKPRSHRRVYEEFDEDDDDLDYYDDNTVYRDSRGEYVYHNGVKYYRR